MSFLKNGIKQVTDRDVATGGGAGAAALSYQMEGFNGLASTMDAIAAGSALRFGTLSVKTAGSLYTYDNSTGTFTANEDCVFIGHIACKSAAGTGTIEVNKDGVIRAKAQDSGFKYDMPFCFKFFAGDTFTIVPQTQALDSTEEVMSRFMAFKNSSIPFSTGVQEIFINKDLDTIGPSNGNAFNFAGVTSQSGSGMVTYNGTTTFTALKTSFMFTSFCTDNASVGQYDTRLTTLGLGQQEFSRVSHFPSGQATGTLGIPLIIDNGDTIDFFNNSGAFSGSSNSPFTMLAVDADYFGGVHYVAHSNSLNGNFTTSTPLIDAAAYGINRDKSGLGAGSLITIDGVNDRFTNSTGEDIYLFACCSFPPDAATNKELTMVRVGGENISVEETGQRVSTFAGIMKLANGESLEIQTSGTAQSNNGSNLNLVALTATAPV